MPMFVEAGIKLVTYDPLNLNVGDNYLGMFIENTTIPKANRRMVIIYGAEDAGEHTGGRMLHYVVKHLLSQSILSSRLLSQYAFLIIPFKQQASVRDGRSRYSFDWRTPGSTASAYFGHSEIADFVIENAVRNWVEDPSNPHPHPEASVFCEVGWHTDQPNLYVGADRANTLYVNTPDAQVGFPGYDSSNGYGVNEFLDGLTTDGGFRQVSWPEFFNPIVGETVVGGGGAALGGQYGGSLFIWEYPWRGTPHKASFYQEEDALENSALAFLQGINTLTAQLYYDNITETVEAQDTSSVSRDSLLNLIEAGNLTDTLTESQIHSNYIFEQIIASSEFESYQQFENSISEVVSAVDIALDTQNYIEELTEYANADATFSQVLQFACYCLESLAASDNIAALCDFLDLINEPNSATDTYHSELRIPFSISELATPGDSLGVTGTYPYMLSEGSNAGGTVVPAFVMANTITETANANETYNVVSSYVCTILESVSLFDDVVGIIAGHATTYDETVSEIAIAATTYAPNLSLSASFSEGATAANSVSVTQDHNPSLTESSTAADVLLSIGTFLNSIAENVLANDSYTPSKVTFDALVEAINASDALEVLRLYVEMLIEASIASDVLTTQMQMVNDYLVTANANTAFWPYLVSSQPSQPVQSTDILSNAMHMARKMISKYGTDVELVLFVDAPPADVNKPWRLLTETELAQTVKCVFFTTRRQKYNENVDLHIDRYTGYPEAEKRCIIAAQGLTNAPQLKGEIRVNGNKWRIISIQELAPAGQSIIYTLQVRA